MTKSVSARVRRDFFTGLAILLPAIISIGVLFWLFGTVSNFTDRLLFFLPQTLTHYQNGAGDVRWYWSLASLAVVVTLICFTGRLTRHYLGKKTIQFVDNVMLSVPLLNKIYGTVKQVNDAFSASSKSSFKQVVLVEFPVAGQYMLGFVTGDASPAGDTFGKKMISVFVPTTPNPTSGFLVFVPQEAVKKIDMSVADGIKAIISLGAISMESTAAPRTAPAKSET